MHDTEEFFNSLELQNTLDINEPIETPAEPKKTIEPEKTNASVQRFLLRMGTALLTQNEYRQAIDVFLKIMDEYPNSVESQVATSSLLTVSQHYEKEGQLRLSLDVLERLEQANN
ncbi:MAG: hypothetical protein RLZ75_2601 [Pseudomonadota bacterium]